MKYKIYFLVFAFIVCSKVTGNAQISISDVKLLTNAATYKGSKEDLLKLIAKNIRYPKDALLSNKLGTVVGIIKISSSGDIIEVGSLNKADAAFKEAFVQVAQKTNGKWVPSNDTAQFFYAVIPVQFTLHESGYSLLEMHKPAYFQETIVSTVAGRPGAFNGLYEKLENSLVTEVNEMVRNEDYNKAITHLIELVNLQPLHTGYYEPLISLLQKTGNPIDAEYYEQVKNLLSN